MRQPKRVSDAPRPGRPGTAVRAKGQQRVQEILDAAVSVIIDDGYSGFTLRRIAELTEISLSNLQYYFPSKEALLQAMMVREFDRSTAELDALIERPAAKPKTRFLQAIDYVLRDQETEARCALFWELWAMSVREPTVSPVMDTFYDQFMRRVTELILDLSPTIGRAVAQRRAGLIVSLLEGASLLRGAGKPRRTTLAGFEKEIRETCLVLASA
ncbi:TetR/AcrR family transcriptional regulator [Phenylobacterium sp.]|uniref:TetR/AcrR family transcriptional regulator n=1 Tax=Phenylobacterium sp. TaxID=1871053 RepID=UPI0030F47B98